MPEAVTPEVTWAQRSNTTDPEKNVLYVTLQVPDVTESSAKLDLKPTSISFSGESTTKHVIYKVDLELYGEIDPENSKSHHSARGIDLVLRKKEMKEEYWPRLLKEAKKMHFLKTDFDKWVDEDEQDEVEEDHSKADGMGGDAGGLGGIDFSALGGAGGGGGGMPDLSALGGAGGGGGGMPDLSALAGGAGGMPDLSALAGGAGGAGGEGEEGEEDLPDLEEDTQKAGDDAKAKVQEIS